MSRPWNASSAIGVKIMPRSIMDNFDGIKDALDKLRGEKKDNEDQIDRNNAPEPNTNKGDNDYYDPYCGYMMQEVDENTIRLQEYVDKANSKTNITPIIIGDYFIDPKDFNTWCYEGNLKFRKINDCTTIIPYSNNVIPFIPRGQRYVHNPSR